MSRPDLDGQDAVDSARLLLIALHSAILGTEMDPRDKGALAWVADQATHELERGLELLAQAREAAE